MSSPEAVRQIFENRDDSLCASTSRRKLLAIMPPQSLMYQSGDKKKSARKAVATAFGNTIDHFDTQTLISDFAGSLKQGDDLPTELTTFCCRLASEFVTGRSNPGLEQHLERSSEVLDQLSLIAMIFSWIRKLPRHHHVFTEFAEAQKQLIAEIESVQRKKSGTSTSFLNYLEHASEKEGISREECRDNATLFAMAIGFNLRVVLLNVFQQLGHSERWQQELRQASCGKSSREISSEKISRAVVKESLRLKPLVPLISRHVKSDTIIDGVRLKAGQMVFVSPWVSHFQSTSFKNPTVFDPGRFLGSERFENCYLPFGGGSRHCVGTGWAIETIGQIIAAIVDRFHLRDQSNTVQNSKNSHRMAAFNLIPVSTRIQLASLPRNRSADV